MTISKNYGTALKRLFMLVSVVFHDYFLEFMLGYQIQNLTKQTYRAIFHYGALPWF